MSDTADKLIDLQERASLAESRLAGLANTVTSAVKMLPPQSAWIGELLLRAVKIAEEG